MAKIELKDAVSYLEKCGIGSGTNMTAELMIGFAKEQVNKILTSVEQLCKQEAEKNPVDKDLFQSGKQQAYSHIYFEIKEATNGKHNQDSKTVN